MAKTTGKGTKKGVKKANKLKYDRKKIAAKAAAAAAAGTAPPEAAPPSKKRRRKAEDRVVSEAPARKIKKAKKIKKAAETSDVSTATPDRVEEAMVTAEEVIETSKKKKKNKKNKKVKSAEADEAKVAEAASAPTSTTTATTAEVAAFRTASEITVSGRGAESFVPHLSFAAAQLPEELRPLIGNFKTPTPIQSEGWPILLAGRDMIGVSETGSGKTLAFAIPGIMRLRANPLPQNRDAGRNQTVFPRMLILAPTRELATQCEDVLVSGLTGSGVSTVCTYGGVPKHQQGRMLRQAARSPNGVVVVATPGRLRDLENDEVLALGQVEYLVLDEADRMLDMGFERDVRAIIGNCMPSPARQTVMFSATWPQSIRELASTFLNDPIKISVGSDELTSNHRVTQTVEVIGEMDRFGRLRELLRKHHSGKNNRVLVFALYKKEAARLENMLSRDFRCNSVHGDKSQPERSRAVDEFRSNACPLLVATDVAARGLDIPDVEVVINYSFPLTIEDYVHRIGRTGRAGKSGLSITFFHDGNKQQAGALVNVLREANQAVPPGLLKYGAGVKKKEHKLYGAFAGKVDMTKKATKITFDD